MFLYFSLQSSHRFIGHPGASGKQEGIWQKDEQNEDLPQLWINVYNYVVLHGHDIHTCSIINLTSSYISVGCHSKNVFSTLCNHAPMMEQTLGWHHSFRISHFCSMTDQSSNYSEYKMSTYSSLTDRFQ